MSRRTKNPFANCDTIDQFADALQARIASGNLTIAEQKAAALLAQIRGWTSQPLPNVDEEPLIDPTNINLSKLRQQLAAGLSPDDTALDWIFNSPDDIFRSRVERITEKSPIATDEDDRSFSIRLCSEALQLVQNVRRTVGGRPVTIDECLSVHAKSSEDYWNWHRPARREALRIIVEAQAPDGYSVLWIVKRQETGSASGEKTEVAK